MTTALLCLVAAIALQEPAPQVPRPQAPRPQGPATVDFGRDVRPLLSDRCFACHGPDADDRRAGLRLDTRDGALAGGRSGPALVPGDAAASAMVRRMLDPDPERRMPPAASHKTVDADELAILRAWIDGGAPYDAHWAYTPIAAQDPPDAGAFEDAGWSDWIGSPIDAWVAGGWRRRGLLGPTATADRETLFRRLNLDLTGLPPSPDSIDRFLAASRRDAERAYGDAVDELLASPAHAERMAMHWLDLVRFADTVGYHGDQEHAISPYRDWVLEAFRTNMPFDRFSTEQLAGDLVTPSSGGDPAEARRTESRKIATGYNRLLQTTHEGGAQAKEYLAIYAADRVRNFGSVWLGQTTGCAQCHDHKYDPISQRDFYSLAAFFADIDEKGDFAGSPNDSPTTRPPELETADGRRTMITVAVEPRPTRVLARGDWMDESGELVEPAAPHYLPPLGVEGRRATRLDLAEWLFRPDHPLTARVVANRLWALMFGRGLAPTLDDFGAQGQPPDHPELLDHLAHDLRTNGWDLRRTLRSIAMSSTYRLASTADEPLRAADPDGRFRTRQSRWRVQAETVRDIALETSGLLVDEFGGRSVRPYQPAGYYRHLNFPKRTYRADRGDDQWRRGVYVHWQRMFLHPQLLAFDAPTREECCAQRAVSNTPQAALTTLNDPSFVEAARGLGERMLRHSRSDAARLEHGFRWVTSRRPDAAERRALRRILFERRRYFDADAKRAEAFLGVGRHKADESLGPAEERAAWAAVGRVLLNLHETILRS